ncbi:hypothetical protein SNE40_011638 [Patella caerulea]|uniref:Ig-like domain-containing protein n=1 Tax=Patella caerulea TaxID=87958 RepID=A0AAN8JNU0_PATCE
MENTLTFFLLATFLPYLTGDIHVEKIEIMPSGSPVWMLENEPFKIACEITMTIDDGSPQVHDITKNGFPIQQQGYTVTTTESVKDEKKILVHTVTKDVTYMEDEGRYTCQAGVKDDIKIIKVFTVYTQDTNITSGEDASIRCDPEPSIEQLKVVWYKFDQPVEAIPDLLPRLKLSDANHTLTIKDATAVDAGEYKCSIIFYDGTPIEQKFEKKAKMFGKPKILEEKSSVNGLKVMKNETLNLMCTVTGYPTPDVVWLKNGEIIKEQNIGEMMKAPFTLTHPIKNLSKSDMGEYSCSFENMMGRVTRSFVVDILGFEVNHGASVTSVFSTLISCFGVFLFLLLKAT